MPTTKNKTDSIARKYILTQRRNDIYLLYERSGHGAGLSAAPFNGFYDTSKHESMHYMVKGRNSEF